MTEFVFESLRTMAEAVRQRRISSRELMQAHLDRIGAVNPSLNAVVEVAAGQALEAAFHADERQARGERLGPFHGVPMTVKGAWDCAGFQNTGGTLGRKGRIAESDATVIARMKHAGFLPIGQTNLPEFSFAFESDNLIYGRTNNPYSLERTPGGSGGGGAAAIAAGCSPFEIGGDMAGSIRLPCHFSGIAGLKPTLGRVPLTGYFPGPFGPVMMFATAGPMARFVEDLYLPLELMSGPDLLDATVADARLGSPSEVPLEKLRIAFHTSNGLLEATTETCTAVERAAKALEPSCARVVEARPDGLAESYEIQMGILGADGCAGLEQLIQLSGTRETSALLQGIIAALRPRETSGAGFGDLIARRDLCRMRIVSFFREHEVLLCPVNPDPAFRHGESVARLQSFSYTMAHSVSGCPAAVVRCGTSLEGLPIGVQVVAAPWREDLALAVAARLEGELGGWQRPPI